MSEQKSQDDLHKKCRKPHVLVVDRDENYARSIVLALRESAICSKSARTVDAFLDLNCQARVDLVLVEVDAFDQGDLDTLSSLRTYFGVGPGTRIIATSTLEPNALPLLVERHGADLHIPRKQDPLAMVAALKAALNQQTDLV